MDNSTHWPYLSREALEELKKIHFEETGVKLTDGEAKTMAKYLFNLVRSLRDQHVSSTDSHIKPVDTL